MFRRSSQVLATISLFLFAMFGVATADEFHYNNFLIGDRAAGMGGAYTAIRVNNTDRAPVVTSPATFTGPENGPLTVNVTKMLASWRPLEHRLPPSGTNT